MASILTDEKKKIYLFSNFTLHTHVFCFYYFCSSAAMSNKIKTRKEGYPTESLLKFMGLNSILICNGMKMQCFSRRTVLQPNSHIDFSFNITSLFTSTLWKPVNNNVTVKYLAFEY
jgi:hypothetical protein